MKQFILLIRSPSQTGRNYRTKTTFERDLIPFKNWLKSMQAHGCIQNYLRLEPNRLILSQTGTIDPKVVEYVDGGRINHVLLGLFENEVIAFELIKSCPLPSSSWSVEVSEIMP